MLIRRVSEGNWLRIRGGEGRGRNGDGDGERGTIWRDVWIWDGGK